MYLNIVGYHTFAKQSTGFRRSAHKAAHGFLLSDITAPDLLKIRLHLTRVLSAVPIQNLPEAAVGMGVGQVVETPVDPHPSSQPEDHSLFRGEVEKAVDHPDDPIRITGKLSLQFLQEIRT